MRFFQALPLPTADAAALARYVTFLRTPDPFGQLEFIFRQAWGVPAACNFFPKTGSTPAFFRATLGADTVVLIDGISAGDQARFVMNGYEGTIQSGVNNPENQTFMGWASDIVSRLDPFGVLAGDNLTLVGWSAGGAVAAIIAASMVSRSPRPNHVRLVSFGAPRCGNAQIAGQVRAACTASRYMRFDDPIPNFPPRSGTFTWIPFAVGLRSSIRFSNFVHHFGGLLVNSAGGISEALLPDMGDITARVALDAFWNGLDADAFSSHSLTKYADLISTVDDYRPARTLSAYAPSEHTLNAEGPVVARQERASVNLVRDLQASQDAIKPNLPPSRVAKAVRTGHVWYVVFGDTPVAMTPNKRRARRIVRLLNEFLILNCKAAFVDPVAFVSQFQAWYIAAQDPASLIRPTMNTTIPL